MKVGCIGMGRIRFAYGGICFMSSEELYLLRLRIVADADPITLVRVLDRFQNLNVMPRKVTAELCTTGLYHVEVDVFGISEDTLRMIAGKLCETTCIRTAHWYRI
jgi:hypothetical protein